MPGPVSGFALGDPEVGAGGLSFLPQAERRTIASNTLRIRRAYPKGTGSAGGSLAYHSYGSVRVHDWNTCPPVIVSLTSYRDDLPSQSRSPTARNVAKAPDGSGTYSYV